MDNSSTYVRFAPDRRYTVAAGAGAVVVAVLAVIADDSPSRLLLGIGVVVLLALVLGDLVFTPRLEASSSGVTVRSPLLRTSLHWAQIEAIRADARVRLGLSTLTLEVDAGETLAVLSRRAIGTDPVRAAEMINACRPPS